MQLQRQKTCARNAGLWSFSHPIYPFHCTLTAAGNQVGVPRPRLPLEDQHGDINPEPKQFETRARRPLACSVFAISREIVCGAQSISLRPGFDGTIMFPRHPYAMFHPERTACRSVSAGKAGRRNEGSTVRAT